MSYILGHPLPLSSIDCTEGSMSVAAVGERMLEILSSFI